MSSLKLPSWLTIGLGVVAGIVGALNVTTFGLGIPWSQLVTFGAAAVAGMGIAPLTHSKLRNALHLTYPMAMSVAAAATTACAAVTATSWDSTLKGIVVGVLTAAAGVLVGPDGKAAPAPAPTPAPAPASK